MSAEGTDLVGALNAAGADLERAPQIVLDLDDRTFCGSDVHNHDDREMSGAARCFLDRHIAELDAVYVSTGPTIEGDPITTVYVTGWKGGIATFTDSSRDAFGSGEWSRENARRVAVPSSFGIARIELVDATSTALDADLPLKVDEDAPDWFIDREQLRWCGMEVRTEDQVIEARACFRDAVSVGDPAEYVVGHYGDEGERAIQWFRVLGPGEFEVIERTLPGQPPADKGAPAWTRYHCSQLDFIQEPGSEVDLIPTYESPPCEEIN